MNNQTIQLGSQSIYVSIKKGKIGTTPLLVCNGIGANTSLLTPFVEALHKSNPDIEIITYDNPGTGNSSTPMFPYRFSGLAGIIDEMLEKLGYGQVDVLGLSWGGFISQQLAYDYPKRVRKLILCATATGCTSIPPSLKVLSLMSSPRRYIDPSYMAKIAPELYGGAFVSNPELAIKYAQKMQEGKSGNKGNGLGYKYQQMAICWWSSMWMLPFIKQPTLLVNGSDDPLINPVNMKVMNGLLPNSELRTIEKGGHLFLLTHLDEVVPMVSEFLER